MVFVNGRIWLGLVSSPLLLLLGLTADAKGHMDYGSNRAREEPEMVSVGLLGDRLQSRDCSMGMPQKLVNLLVDMGEPSHLTGTGTDQ